MPIMVSEMKLSIIRAWAVLGQRQDLGEQVVDIRQPSADQDVELRAKDLLAANLPRDFGERARADTYLAPAALDLLAPPFGISFPDLGIEDAL